MRTLASVAKADQLHLALNCSRSITPHPQSPSFSCEIQFKKGHMWLISDYILNEGYCWLVAFIGTLISYYSSTLMWGKRGSTLGRKRSKSRQRRGKWSERESAEKGEGSGSATKQGNWKIGLLFGITLAPSFKCLVSTKMKRSTKRKQSLVYPSILGNPAVPFHSRVNVLLILPKFWQSDACTD